MEIYHSWGAVNDSSGGRGAVRLVATDARAGARGTDSTGQTFRAGDVRRGDANYQGRCLAPRWLAGDCHSQGLCGILARS